MLFGICVCLILLVILGTVLKMLRGVLRGIGFLMTLVLFTVVLYYMVDAGVSHGERYLGNALEQTTNEIYGWHSFTAWLQDKWGDIKLSMFP